VPDHRPVVEFKAIAKAYHGQKVLDGFNLSIAEGEFLTLLGPSGCGKTTLLRLLAGFETPDAGDILLDGERVNALTPDRRNVNTVFQSYALFPHLSVFDNVAFGLRMKKTPRLELRKRVEHALAAVHLPEYGHRLPGQLSGGQQQRVALARALVNRPRVLLLDEPLSALDSKLRRAMQVELKALQRQLGITFLFVTHDQEEALSMSDRVVVMRAGMVEQIGGPREIYELPASLFVAQFVGESNLLQGRVSERVDADSFAALVEGLACVLRLAKSFNVGDRFSVLLRPEDLHLVDPSDPSARLRGQLVEQIYKGMTLECVVELDSGKRLSASAFFDPEEHALDFQIGQRVGLSWVGGREVVLRSMD
jgi:spermidine/putrescine transport system ATP-binding protein